MLVVLIRICLIPLFVRQIKAQRGLQALQPQMKAIQTKYKNDKAKQQEELGEFLASRLSNPFKPGDRVRVDNGGIYSGLVASVDRISGHDRIEVLLGMIRHSLPADMVVAA